jgi:hypothetical protein
LVSLVVIVAVAVSLIVTRSWSSSSTAANADRYNESTTFVSTALSICVDASLTGTITYNAAHAGTFAGQKFALTSIRLLDPVVTATVHAWTRGTGCTAATASVTHMSLSQQWASYSSHKMLVSYTTHYGSGGTFTQNNTGSSARFADLVGAAGTPALCYGATIDVSFGGKDSATTDEDGGSAVKRICLTPTV